MHRCLQVFVLALLVLIAIPASGQSGSSTRSTDDAATLDSVVVTGPLSKFSVPLDETREAITVITEEQLDRFTLGVNIKNLLDERYFTAGGVRSPVDGEPRTVLFTVRTSF